MREQRTIWNMKPLLPSLYVTVSAGEDEQRWALRASVRVGRRAFGAFGTEYSVRSTPSLQ